jgi:Xaa-Pro aminopeptidase
LTTEAGAAHLLVTPEQDYLVANNIESCRIMEEEGLAELNIQPLVYQWDSPDADVARLIERVLAGQRHTTDTGQFAGELNRLRYSLTPLEVERYRALGRDSARVMADVCRAIEPGQSEWDVTGALSQGLWAQQIVPAVVLVAADERISQFRHPIPTSRKVGKCVMVVMCGRRHGLILSTTRLVHFGALPSELRKKHDACMRVDAAYVGSTQIGADVDEVFQKGLDMYDETGFREEWTMHHQGGGTGYTSRDFKGSLHCKERVQPWQAYAWNPSITGTKSEDTVVATPDGPEIISMLKDWPSVEVPAGIWGTVRRADILVR